MEPEDRIIVALDVSSAEEALGFVEKLVPYTRVFKVGSQLFTAEGPTIIRAIQDRGGEVFLNLKWHDIPEQVAGASREVISQDVYRMSICSACTVRAGSR